MSNHERSNHHETSNQEHVPSLTTYSVVFLGLMVLLAASIVTNRFDWGPWNLVVAMSISFVKTMLVVLFFMHVLYSSRLTKVMAAAGALWLIFLIVLTFSDYQTRGWLSPAELREEPTVLDRGSPRK